MQKASIFYIEYYLVNLNQVCLNLLPLLEAACNDFTHNRVIQLLIIKVKFYSTFLMINSNYLKLPDDPRRLIVEGNANKFFYFNW